MKRNKGKNKSFIRKQMSLKLGSTVLALIITMDGVITLGLSKNLVKYTIANFNPFNGSKIISDDLVTNYKMIKSVEFLNYMDEEEAVEFIKNAGEDRKKAYLLYYAILANQSLNEDEKKLIKGAFKYFCDNEYIDAEYVYNKLLDINVVERDADFPDTSILSTFECPLIRDAIFGDIILPGGKIRLGSEEHLFHEYIAHGTSNNLFISWIEEGYAEIISEEYYNISDSYPVESSVIKFLCEIMGKETGRECFFKIHAIKLRKSTLRLDLLSNYLYDAGVPTELSDELFLEMDDFSKFRGKILTSEEASERQEILKKIIMTLAKIYESANSANNKTPLTKYTCDTYLLNILNDSKDSDINKLHYFNIDEGEELSSISHLRQFYPILEYKEIFNITDEELNSWDFIDICRKINGSIYVEITNEESLLCDDSKIEYYMLTYDTYNGKCEYRLNKKNQEWELALIYNTSSLDGYFYSNNNAKMKVK